MAKKRHILPVVLAAGAVGVLAWLSFRPPVYHGKPLTAWLNQYGSNHWASNPELDHQAEAAIRHFGTNLIPEYLNMISTHPSSFKRSLLGRMPKSWRFRLHLPSADDYDQALDTHRNRGAFGLIALGGDAKPAVPALITLLNDRNLFVRRCSIFALSNLGVAARDALPVLIKCLNDHDGAIRLYALGAIGAIRDDPDHSIPALLNFLDKNRGDSVLRFNAINYLGQFQTHAAPAVPSLLKLLNDPDAHIRNVTIIALGRIGAQPDLVVPALVSNLAREQEKNNLFATLYALGQYGPGARSAVPTILQFTTDSESFIRSSAISALKAISPEAIPKAGVK